MATHAVLGKLLGRAAPMSVGEIVDALRAMFGDALTDLSSPMSTSWSMPFDV